MTMDTTDGDFADSLMTDDGYGEAACRGIMDGE